MQTQPRPFTEPFHLDQSSKCIAKCKIPNEIINTNFRITGQITDKCPLIVFSSLARQSFIAQQAVLIFSPSVKDFLLHEVIYPFLLKRGNQSLPPLCSPQCSVDNYSQYSSFCSIVPCLLDQHQTNSFKVGTILFFESLVSDKQVSKC